MRNKEKVGDLIKVPYKQGWHTYARVLVEWSFAFYDCPSEVERNDFQAIINSDILFTAYVEREAVKSGNWTIVENIPLEERLKNFYPRYFNPDPTATESIGFYEIYKKEIEVAIESDWIKTGKMQLHGIYGRVHIAERINAYYDGKKYYDNQLSIETFKKMSGLS